MSQTTREEIVQTVRQHLEIERFLGLREVPFPPVSKDAAATSASPATPTVRAVPAPAIASDEVARRETELRGLDEKHVKGCRKCHLHQTRTKTVFGQGSAGARLVFVGEAPGADEDAQGLAFVGKAGQLLTKMIEAMGLMRDQVFICNVLKCRPPNNRTPADDEIAACSPYLLEQLRILQPQVIVALGAPASQTLLRTKEGIGRLRGRFHDFYISGSAGIGNPTPLMPTFHPAYLLRSPGEKVKAWDDLMKVMDFLGLAIPEQYRRRG